jgi:trans-aconitate methyltransferase
MRTSPDSSHWEHVYGTKAVDEVSWFQTDPALSLELIGLASLAPDAGVIDVGGGASVLAGRLLEAGYTDISVLDIAESALSAARRELATRGAAVHWLIADVLDWAPSRRYALWHDRAVFHFLTEAVDRARYLGVAEQAIAPGGHLVIGTFAADGPQQCSGLPTARYDAVSLAAEFPTWTVRAERREEHRTPWDSVQAFTWLLLERAT